MFGGGKQGTDVLTVTPVLVFHSSCFGIASDIGGGCAGSLPWPAVPLRLGGTGSILWADVAEPQVHAFELIIHFSLIPEQSHQPCGV